MKDIINTVIFFLLRTFAILIAFFVAYFFVFKAMKPTFLDNLCFTDTDKCNLLYMYRYKNTFLAQDSSSEVWFWYNGSKLFIYGQLNGKCDLTEYVPVVVLSVSKNVKNTSELTYEYLPSECIYTVETIISMYKKDYSCQLEKIHVLNTSSDITNNIFNIIQTLYNNNTIHID